MDYLQDLYVLQSVGEWDRLRISGGRLKVELRSSFQGARRALSGDGRDGLRDHLTQMLAAIESGEVGERAYEKFNKVREGVALLRVTTYNQDEEMVTFLSMFESELTRKYAQETRPAYRRALLMAGFS